MTIVTRADTRSVDDIEKLIARKIEWGAPGAETSDEVVNAEAPAPTRAPRGEGRSQGRGRSRLPSRDDLQNLERPARTPRAEREAQPEREASPERHAKPTRDAQPVRSEAPHAPRRPLPEPLAAAASQRRHSRHEPIEERVIGLGDHVPSFLLRPTRAPRPTPVEAED